MAKMFEVRDRVERHERAILVGVEQTSGDVDGWSVQESLEELGALAQTAGLEVSCHVVHRRSRPDPSTFLGSGKVEELRTLNREIRADAFLLDNELSPAQVRNLERRLDTKVLDRTEIILDIFAQRARTREAQLQVELAQLEHALPRLTRHWTHLSRLGGGSGVGGGVGTRGPGETQLQMDRRWIRHRISHLRGLLAEVSQRRAVQRRARREVFSCSLVGYTNAGKSSLMNALLGAEEAVCEGRLFATLDPLTRVLSLPGDRFLALTDTVGFIHRLPHRLVAAFRATLEEVCEADLLLHVVDAAHPHVRRHVAAVHQVLEELGATDVPMGIALNKIDLLHDFQVLDELRSDMCHAWPVSARTGEGLDALREELAARAGAQEQGYWFRFPSTGGRLLSYLYEHGCVEAVEYGEAEITVRAHVDPRYVSPLRPYVVLHSVPAAT